MSSQERRKKLTIDEVNVYWRSLKDGVARPELHTLCNAIRTLDLALAENGPSLCKRLSSNVWSRLRNDCFDILVSSFAGHFVVLAGETGLPVEAGSDWPDRGTLEFYPERMKRREDSFQAQLDKIHPDILVRFRWSLAEGNDCTSPKDFAAFTKSIRDFSSDEEADRARELLYEMYTSLACEAKKLKKIAHRQWWQLQSQASTCLDRRHKSELRRQMDNLELVWGKSTSYA